MAEIPSVTGDENIDRILHDYSLQKISSEEAYSELKRYEEGVGSDAEKLKKVNLGRELLDLRIASEEKYRSMIMKIRRHAEGAIHG